MLFSILGYYALFILIIQLELLANFPFLFW